MAEPTASLSHYEAIAAPRVAAAPLAGTLHAEVCVIGGGLLGVSAAHHLAAAGRNVALIEARRLGSGASGRNGGQVIPGFSCAPAEMSAIAGVERARAIWRWTCDATLHARELAHAHAPHAIAGHGELAAATDAEEVDELRADQAHVRDVFGDDALQWLDADDARLAIGSSRYAGALRDPRAFPLDPLALLYALADAASGAGAVLHEDTPAVAIGGGTPWRVTTPDGEIIAEHVVLTVQAATGALWRPRRDLTLPIWTSMISTVPLDLDRRTRILPDGEAVYDASPMMAYWRVSPDGRVLFGAGASGKAETPAETSSRLKERLTAIYPMLADVAIDRVWSGVVDLTLDRLPRFGRGTERLWIAHGLGGHGIAAAVGGGAAIARAIAGDATDFDLVAGLPQRRIPLAGLVARWAVPATFAWLRAVSRWSGRRR